MRWRNCQEKKLLEMVGGLDRSTVRERIRELEKVLGLYRKILSVLRSPKRKRQYEEDEDDDEED